jgi:hypothetical protein
MAADEMAVDDTDRQTGNGENGNEPVLSDALRELCAELVAVQARAQALGLFISDRPVLKCPHCHLLEDITIEGYLVVYPERKLDLAAAPRVTCDWDTGLRFADRAPNEVGCENQFLCPACGFVFTAPEEEPPDD